MLIGPGIQRAEGMLGFDWVTHRGDPLPANTDMEFTVALPPGRSTTTGTASTSSRRCPDGTSTTSCAATTARRSGRGLRSGPDRPRAHRRRASPAISGLAALLPAGATSFTGGNIILGGAGTDIIEGRGGDDIIDGDRWLNAELQVGTTRYPGVNNVYVPGTSNVCTTACAPTLRLLAAQGTVNPGAISIVRTINTPPAGTFVDTAVFSGLLAEYDIVLNANGSVTVTHIDPDDPTVVGIDGIDTLWNIERLTFADQSVELGGGCSTPRRPAR